MSFHELGHDLVLAGELGFELLDFLVLGLLDGLALAAAGEGEVAVLEELFEPVVDLVGVQIEFIAQVGHGDLVDEVPFEEFVQLANANVVIVSPTEIESFLKQKEDC